MAGKQKHSGMFDGYRTRQEQLEAQEAEAMGGRRRVQKNDKASKKK